MLVISDGPDCIVLSTLLPEDINRSSFQNVVFCLEYRLMVKVEKHLILTLIYHHQNPLEIMTFIMLCFPA
jgi:hypothetical protein